jgi:UDP-GlcNAc:undecaprenyl-phosphate GlcNAc-1-phosphate transferase
LLLANFTGSIIAFGLTSALILWLCSIARKVGLVDVPNERKTHEGEVPLIGGLAIFIAIFAAILISGFFLPDGVAPLDNSTSGFFLAGMVLLLAGVVDDYLELTPMAKILAQTVAAIIMIYAADVVLADLGELGNEGALLSTGIFAVPFTIFATIGVVNAINMSDGLDGLAGSLSLVSLLGFIGASVLFGSGQDLGMLIVLASAVAGFLVFNFRFPGRRSAMVFLGDSGSMLLGLAVCWYAIKFSQGTERVIAPSAALWFLILPLFDAVSMTTRRILKRRPPFGADKEHLHHVFLLAGFTVPETVLVMSGVSLLGVAIGIGGTYFGVPDYLMVGSFLTLGLMYLWMIVRSWTVMRFLSRSINRRTSVVDRRVNSDRRRNASVAYLGPERRSSIDRRRDPRRTADNDLGFELDKAG